MRSGIDADGSQFLFQFIQKVLDGVKVRALCGPVKFFHDTLIKPYLYSPFFVSQDTVMLR